MDRKRKWEKNEEKGKKRDTELKDFEMGEESKK